MDAIHPSTHRVVVGALRVGKTMYSKVLFAQQVPALRACALCMHSAVPTGATDMACLCPDVIAVHGRNVTAQAARAAQGACGPDAHHLDMHAWRAHREHTTDANTQEEVAQP